MDGAGDSQDEFSGERKITYVLFAVLLVGIAGAAAIAWHLQGRPVRNWIGPLVLCFIFSTVGGFGARRLSHELRAKGGLQGPGLKLVWFVSQAFGALFILSSLSGLAWYVYRVAIGVASEGR